jgi:HSP20 family protein
MINSIFFPRFQANTPWWDSYVTLQTTWNDLARQALSTVPSPLGWTDEADVFRATQRAAERLLSDAFNTTQSSLPWIQKGQLMPTLDITETDQAFALRVELPGIAADDVEVSTKHGSLIVRGEKKAEQTQDNASCLRRECTYGSFERVVALPKEADLNKAEATFKNNVLAIQIPKTIKAAETAVKIPVLQEKGAAGVSMGIKTEGTHSLGQHTHGAGQSAPAKKIA